MIFAYFLTCYIAIKISDSLYTPLRRSRNACHSKFTEIYGLSSNYFYTGFQNRVDNMAFTVRLLCFLEDVCDAKDYHYSRLDYRWEKLPQLLPNRKILAIFITEILHLNKATITKWWKSALVLMIFATTTVMLYCCTF